MKWHHTNDLTMYLTFEKRLAEVCFVSRMILQLAKKLIVSWWTHVTDHLRGSRTKFFHHSIPDVDYARRSVECPECSVT
jgi:hypothetical protein